MTEAQITVNGAHILYDKALLSEVNEALFSPSEDAVNHLGRGKVTFFTHREETWVLRPYRRGGLVRHVCADHYLYLGLDRTRMAREFRLLMAMRAKGLPVPVPVAVHIIPKGLVYSGSLITKKLDSDGTLAEHLEKAPLDKARWQAIGACIARFHREQIYHADLNANNIMLGEDAVYLIDFDRGEQRTHSIKWKNDNIERLRRSLDKLQNKKTCLFSEEDWRTLVAGYQDGSAAR